MADARWIALDVGETLVDETRLWSCWADALGIPRLTFMAALGAALARGRDFRDVFEIVGRADWRDLTPDVGMAYGSFVLDDLYPDALPALDSLRRRGYRLAILANQPARRTAELRALGACVDVMAMSDELGVHKPDAQFFRRGLELMGGPNPADVAYVGDRIDNDVRPSAAVGMRAVWLRRGPWGVIAQTAPPATALIVQSLSELVERVEEVWEPVPAAPPARV
ncbi:MAG TPA: HAD family hydrolase [Candidatus Caenarcaniphilales bacterium]|nr:HAD family hydrolase [Candidatus Caenarcaniphilales bacterium]